VRHATIHQVTIAGRTAGGPFDERRLDATLPESRSDMAAASNGAQVVVCGGLGSDGHLRDETLMLSEDGDLATLQPLPQGRARHAMAYDGERFLAIGGVTLDRDGCLTLAEEVLAYDARGGSWTVVSEMPRRAEQLVAEVVNNRLYAIGGDTGTATSPGRPIAPATCRSQVEVLDLSTFQWTTGSPKPTPETGVSSALLENRIFVCSSYDPTGAINNLVEVYDTEQDSWQTVTGMPTPRTGLACGFIDGKLVCINGQGRGLRALSVIEIYDTESDRWITADTSLPPSYASAYVTAMDRVFIFGGYR
jgi:hypothetical protein